VTVSVDNSHELITGLSKPLFAPAALSEVGSMPSRRVMSSGLKWYPLSTKKARALLDAKILPSSIDCKYYANYSVAVECLKWDNWAWCVFWPIVNTHSGSTWTPIPAEREHPFWFHSSPKFDDGNGRTDRVAECWCHSGGCGRCLDKQNPLANAIGTIRDGIVTQVLYSLRNCVKLSPFWNCVWFPGIAIFLFCISFMMQQSVTH